MNEIQNSVWENAWTYEVYRTEIDRLLEENKTTGSNQSEDYLHYTRMNVARMNRLDKRTEVEERLAQEAQGTGVTKILVLTEAWCGDAAQVIPVAEKIMAELGISARYILRDEHLDIMDAFLTEGGRSIPKFIFLNDALEVLGSWGPRPDEVQQMVMDRKQAEVQEPYTEFSKKVQLWYAKDKTRSIQEEFVSALQKSVLTFSD